MTSEAGDPDDDLDLQHTTPPSRPRPGAQIAGAVGVTLFLTLGGGLAYHRWDDAQAALLATAVTAYEGAQHEHDAAVQQARLALGASEGRVADDAVRVALSDLVEQTPSDTATTGPRAERASALDDATSAVRRLSARVRDATRTVVSAHDAWELAQASAAYARATEDLAAAIGAASDVLDASEGRVHDDGARQALADLIATSRDLADGDAAVGLDDLTSTTTTVVDATSALQDSARVVTEQRAVWQAEQDRLAAERAAEARATETRRPGATGASGGTTARSRSGSAAATPGRVDSTPGTAGPEVEVLCIVTDEHGGSWAC
jgi:hypothetical protein